jgi:hypothetical protein
MNTGCLNGYEGGQGEEQFGLKGRITNLVIFQAPELILHPHIFLTFLVPHFWLQLRVLC